MNHFEKKGLENLVIHTCDGDDDLTEEQSKQAFCLETPEKQVSDAQD